MPTDTTLDLLRRLQAAGGLPDWWRLTKGESYLKGPTNSGAGWIDADSDKWTWALRSKYAFTVALQEHLARLGVATMCCGAEALHYARVENEIILVDSIAEPGLEWLDESWWHRGGPGVDGLLRAAVACLEARESREGTR